jgi:hypothetical protein
MKLAKEKILSYIPPRIGRSQKLERTKIYIDENYTHHTGLGSHL